VKVKGASFEYVSWLFELSIEILGGDGIALANPKQHVPTNATEIIATAIKSIFLNFSSLS
jgi:hypothetical protein